ncbi:MAG: ATP-dependent DNA helicase [Actinomycetota bacterium]|nr:ATP-dependent DNA helicase [Actinomycetota bacterium]MDA3014709.1 ATP-dependent DNA helicase [Actinomycetota bacterium]
MTDPSILDLLDGVTEAIPGAERRTGQREMAERIGLAIRRGSPLVVRAGTGTGKTLAYLVPAIESGRTTIVVTATKALQDQLAHKDLPFLELHLEPLLGRPFSWAVLKGRSNYICMQRLDEIAATKAGDRVQLSLEGLDDSGRAEVDRLVAWTTETITGDLTELDWAPSDRTVSAVTVGSDECPGASRCPRGTSCFAEAARGRAQTADVIVVNAHLYGLDVGADGAILGDHEVVIFDEAHVIEDVMSDTVGVELTSGRLNRVATVVRRIVVDPDLDAELSGLGDDLAEILARYPGEQVPTPLPTDLNEVIASIRDTNSRALDLVGKLKIDDEDAKQRRLRAQVALGRVVDTTDRFLSPGAQDVTFVSGAPGSLRLELAPLDVGPTLADGIWSKRTAVLTSATVPRNLAERIGLEGADLVDVGSPFDYEEQALLYCAMHLPPPNDPAFRSGVHDELTQLMTAAGGRTLALFTSWSAMDEAAAALRERVPFRILTQRDMPKPALLHTFATDEDTCLFATAGLFQGVDVPGRTLSLVVIDRIPFPRPDDPLLTARRDLLGPRAFAEIDLPRAATMLAQASGRLIRTDTDRGVVAVMDRRLGAARYRWEIIAALPPMRRTRDRAEAIDLLRSIAER